MDAKTRKYYDPEFKRNAADLYLNGKQSLAEITQSLGVPESTLYGWVIEFKKNGKESFKPKVKWSNGSLHLTKELNSRKEVIYDRQKSEEKIYGRV